VTFARTLPDIDGLMRCADVVVSMGGYNSVCEAVDAGKRPIVVPLAGATGEQEIRAERFAALGLATVVPERELTGDRLCDAIVDELARGASLVHGLDFDGRRQAVDALLALLAEDVGGRGARRERRVGATA
jgi:predicted glycosyltransferase